MATQRRLWLPIACVLAALIAIAVGGRRLLGEEPSSRAREEVLAGGDRHTGAPARGATTADGDAGREPPEAEACAQVQLVDLLGEPVPGSVIAHHADEPVYRGWVATGSRRVTNADGRAEVCGAAGLGLSIEARSHDGSRGRGGWGPHEWEGETVVVRVTRPSRVHGLVVDEEGHPVVGARILVGSYWPRAESDRPHFRPPRRSGLHLDSRVVTDREGRFDTALLGLGHLQLGAQAEGYSDGWVGPIYARPGTDREVEIVLPAGVALTGVVRDADGPIAGAALYVRRRGLTPGVRIELDDGHFDISSTHPDERFSLDASAPGYLPYSIRDLPPGHYDIELERGARLTVRVDLDPTLTPCYGATGSTTPSGDAEWTPIQVARVYARLDPALGPTVHGVWDEEESTVTFDAIPPGPSELMVRGTVGGESVSSHVFEAGMHTSFDVHLSSEPGRGILRVLAPNGEALLSLHDSTGTLHTSQGVHVSWLCLSLDPGTYRIQNGERREEVTIRGGLITNVEVYPVPVPEPSPSLPRCGAGFESVLRGGRVYVGELRPTTVGLAMPGDRVLDVRGDEERTLSARLVGPPGTPVDIHIERPDGTRDWITLVRGPCP